MSTQTPTLPAQQQRPADPVTTINTLLVRNKDALFAAVPKHLTADRMIRVATTELRKNPKLAECDQRSLIGCIVESSQLGLEIGGYLGHAYLVPYKVKGYPVCQLIVGYKGMVDIARRSGEISTIQARVVHERDEFNFEFGLSPTLKHKPSTDDNPGKVKYAYAVCVLKDGGTQFEVMTVREIEGIRSRSRSKDNGPWVTDWEEMAKKTVLRRLCKLLPVSVELQRAAAIDERSDDTFQLPLNLGADLALPLPESPVDKLESEPEGGEQGSTGGTRSSQLADKLKKGKATVFDNFKAFIENAKSENEFSQAFDEITVAKDAGDITADQATELGNMLAAKRAS
ncbi:MAG: recombination protein RecT [Planctomycetaceae bacterium]|nr:recombination protein RecT [Planctomycetaceae bacterium]